MVSTNKPHQNSMATTGRSYGNLTVSSVILHFALCTLHSMATTGRRYVLAFLLPTFADRYICSFFCRVRQESSDEQFKFSSVILHFALCILHSTATTGRRYGNLTVLSVILNSALKKAP